MTQEETSSPRPRISLWIWIGAAALALFLVFGLSAFQKSLTPYVSFAEARKQAGVVQVAGALIKGSDNYDTEKSLLHFTLIDEQTADKIEVVYSGIKPANFHDAISIVAIGRFDGSAIQAEKLLVKCPSKYQGQEVKEYSAGKSA